MLSKRSTLIAITVMAALSIEVGCGDGQHRTTVRKDLTGNAPKTQQVPVTDAQGNPVMDPKTGKPMMKTVPAGTVANGKGVGLDGKPLPAGVADGTGTTVKNADGTTTKTAADGTKTTYDASGKLVPNPVNVQADKNLDVILKSEQDLLAGNVVPREALVAGTYEVQTMTTSAHILLSSGEETRGIQNSTFRLSAGNGVDLTTGDSLAGGTVATFVDTPRRLDIPTKFTVDLSNGGKWNGDLQNAAHMTVQDLVTTKDGKALMNDSLGNGEVSPSSILAILAANDLQQGKNANAYFLKDSSGISMTLRLIKSDTQLRVAVSFEEQRASGTGTSAQNINLDRNIFVTYKITPAPNGGKAAQDDQINVKQVAPNQTLGTQDATVGTDAPSTIAN